MAGMKTETGESGKNAVPQPIDGNILTSFVRSSPGTNPLVTLCVVHRAFYATGKNLVPHINKIIVMLLMIVGSDMPHTYLRNIYEIIQSRVIENIS